MTITQPLEAGRYYHIYNRGVNGVDLFYGEDNYKYFLKLYCYHLNTVVDTYAWCLMGNHFHLLVRVKEFDEILQPPLTGFGTLSGVEQSEVEEAISRLASQKFSNFFNAYAQALNKQQGRHGTLFERPFRRKMVESGEYFIKLVVYIHFNPVHHGFTGDFANYPWSSYGSFLGKRHQSQQVEQVLEWFGGLLNFIDVHKQLIDFGRIEHLLLE